MLYHLVADLARETCATCRRGDRSTKLSYTPEKGDVYHASAKDAWRKFGDLPSSLTCKSGVPRYVRVSMKFRVFTLALFVSASLPIAQEPPLPAATSTPSPNPSVRPELNIPD